MDDISHRAWDALVAAARVAMDDEGRRAVDRAAWLGVVLRLRAAMARLKLLVPDAVPLGFGAMSDVEVLQWWRADPITPIRQALGAADKAFAGRPGFFENLGAGIGGAFEWVWKVVVGVVIAVGVLVVGGIVLAAVRR